MTRIIFGPHADSVHVPFFGFGHERFRFSGERFEGGLFMVSNGNSIEGGDLVVL